MPAPKQNLYVPLGLGLETDIDDKLLPLGKSLELENCYPVQTGEVFRRAGVAGTSAPAHPFALANHKGALVSMSIPGPTPIAVTPSFGAPWNSSIAGDRRGPVTPALTTVSGAAFAGTVATGAGYNWVIWQDAAVTATAPKLIWQAMDTGTGHVAASGTLTPVSGGTAFNGWQAASAGGFGVFVATQNNNVTQVIKVDPSTNPFTATVSTVSSTGPTGTTIQNWNLDALAFGSIIRVCTVDGSGNAQAFDYNPGTNAVTGWTPKDASAASIPITGGIQWVQDYGGSGKIALFTANGTNGLRAQWDFPSSGATRQAGHTYDMDPGATTGGLFIAGHTTSAATDGQLVVAYGLGITTGISLSTRQTGGATDFGSYVVGMRLATKTWMFNGDSYVGIRFDSATDGTHYVIRLPGQWGPPSMIAPLAQFAVRTSTAVGLGGFTPPGISNVGSPSSGVFTAAITYQPRLEVGAFANAKDRLGVQLATLTHGTTPNTTIGRPREGLGSLFVPHGFLGAFDGRSYCEAGFAYSGQPPVSSTPSAGGGLTASSSYFHVITYARMDATGRIWRSAVSTPFQTNTGVGQGTVTLNNVPYLHLAGFTGGVVEIWRGSANVSTLFQKVGEQANSITLTSFNFADTMTDATLSANEFLYTNGGILENDTPPVFIDIAFADGRFWGISADDPQVLWYSKSLALGLGMGFSEDNTLDVRDQHGAMTALGVVNDKVIVFKRDSVYGVVGSAPNDLGQGGTYDSQLIGEGIGCLNPQSVCEYKDGVAFQSGTARVGYWAVDRGGSLQPIGKEVQRYSGLTITGAMMFSDLEQLRFYSTSGRTLVLALNNGIWTTFTTALGAIHGAVCWRRPSNGFAPVYFLNGSSLCLVEDNSSPVWTDLGDPYVMKATSPWIQINGIRGYERFFRLQPVGAALSVTTLTAALYANFDETAPIVSKAVGQSSAILDMELRYSGKLAGLKVIFTDNAPNGPGIRLSGFSMVVAAKGGLRKAADAVRMT